MENIGWTDRTRNEEVLQIVQEERCVIRRIQGRKGSSNGQVWVREVRHTCNTGKEG